MIVFDVFKLRYCNKDINMLTSLIPMFFYATKQDLNISVNFQFPLIFNLYFAC